MNEQEKLLCQKYHERNETYGVLTFACGASMRPVYPPDIEGSPMSSRKSKRGFIYPLRVENDDGTTLPTFEDGRAAPCRECPKVRMAGWGRGLHWGSTGYRTHIFCHARVDLIHP